MYYVIDNEQLTIRHKGPDVFVLADLAHIELRDGSYEVTHLDDMRRLYTRTETELLTLYRNITGSDTTQRGNNLRKLVLEAASRLPVGEYGPVEVNHQAVYVELRPNEGPFVYVRGSNRPQLVDQLPAGLTTAATTDEAAVLRDWVPPVAPPVQRSTLPAALRDSGPVAAPRAPRQPNGAPRQAGVSQLIFDVADAMWADAGKPTDPKLVLALRKQMMDKLESDHGVKRTTSSNALGGWQKARIPA